MKKFVFIILITFIALLAGCSNDSQSIKSENEQLKNQISKLEKDLDNKNSKIIELQNKELDNLTINYIENASGKRLIEKQCELFGLPADNAIKINSILENTVVTILDTANVNNVIWLYVAIPVYDSPSNYKGWIKEVDTVLYTKDKINKVQSDIKVIKGEAVYDTNKFEDIKSVNPYNAESAEHGRIQEKKDGYIKLECAGGNTIWVKVTSVIYPEVD